MNTKNILLFFCFLVILGLSGWIVYDKVLQVESKSLRTRQVSIATHRDLDSVVVAIGTIKPERDAEIKVGSRASGIIKSMFVKVGNIVSEGDTLGQLDKSEYEASHRQWLAAKQGSDASFEYSNLAVRRIRELYEKKFASEQDKDLAEKAQIIAEYEKKQSEANLEASRVKLEYTEIVAPISGVVSAINIDQGETVAASFLAPTLLTIIDLKRLELWAYVEEADVGRVGRGQKVSFFLDAYPGEECKGRVEFLRPRGEMNEGVMQFVCLIKITDDRDLPLKPEMTATVKFEAKGIPNVLTVPNWSIEKERRRPYVNILSGHTVTKRWVRTGWKDDNFTEILEGLAEGDTILYIERVNTKN